MNNNKIPLPLMRGSFESGGADSYIESLTDKETKALALCELHYYRGEGEACYGLASKLVKSKSGLIRISAMLMMGFGALCMGDAEKAVGVIKTMHTAYLEKETNGICYTDEEKQLMAFINNLSVTLIHLEGIKTLPLPFHTLPMGIRLIAFYVMAHKEYLSGNYGEAAGLAKAGLLLKDGSYPIGEIYLNLVLAMCYINQESAEKATAHFRAAWELAKPDKLYHPFSEHHGLLGGMVEIHLKKSEPEAYETINKQVYRFAQAWRDIHNPHNGETVADVLTTTEFTVAMLASKGWSNDQIAAHLGVSVNTVKAMLKRTYKKLGIKGRNDLKNYMLK